MWLNNALYGWYPYVALTVFLLGSLLRFDHSQYTWRTGSSQLLRRRQMMWGSNLFHVGILAIFAGHFVGLLTPVAVFDALGISHTFKQLLAMMFGGVAGIACWIGLALLAHRRLFDARIRNTSSFGDIAILLLLWGQLTLGLLTIPVLAQHLHGTEMVKFMDWAQGILTLHPGAATLIANVSPIFKCHLFLGMTIFLVFPFTRLVHVWSAPVWYLGPTGYQVVRTKRPIVVSHTATGDDYAMRTVTMRSDAARTVAVNDAIIASADIAREVQNHAGATPKEAWGDATRALVIRELLLQRARSLNLVAEPLSEGGVRETDDEALIRSLLATEVRTPTADEASCRRYYQANRNRFRTRDLFEPQHLLFTASRDDASAYERAAVRAETVLAELKAAPERFEALARAVSDCPSASDGGRLGQVARGDTTPEFEAALLSLEPGTICAEPVRTRYGVHVLKLERKVSGDVLLFELARDRVAAYLEESSWRRAVAQYVALLAGKAQITGFDMPGAPSPLVQ